jgi:HEAT repeat protein
VENQTKTETVLFQLGQKYSLTGNRQALPDEATGLLSSAVEATLKPALLEHNLPLSEVMLHLGQFAFNFSNRIVGREWWVEQQTVQRWLFELELKKSPNSTRRKRNRHYRHQEQDRAKRAEPFIAVGLAAGILEERTQNGTLQLRFVHSLLQDYFAAHYLASQPLNLTLLAEIFGGGWYNFVPNRIWQFWAALEPNLIPKLLDILQFSQDSSQCRAAALVLKYIAKPQINQLLLERFSQASQMREDVIRAIMIIDETAIQLFLLALASQDENIRWEAVMEVNNLRVFDERVIAGILNIIQNEAETPELRGCAVHTLGSVGERNHVPVLCTLYSQNPKLENLRLWILGALGLLGGRAALPTLLTAVSDKAVKVREEAASSLQRAALSLGLDLDRRVTPVLVQLLSDESKEVRQDAAYALSYGKDPLALAPLLARLEVEEDLEVKEALIYTLGHFHPTQVWSVIEEYSKASQPRDLRLTAIGTCRTLLSENENIQPEYIEKILNVLDAALEDEDKAVRRSVAEVLAKLPAVYHPLVARFIPAILAVATDLEVDSYYRRKALDALGNLKPLNVVLDPLLELLTVEAERRHIEEEQNDVLFHEVLAVLGQFGHEASVQYAYDYLKRLYDGSEMLSHPSDANELIETFGKVPDLRVDITNFLLEIVNDKGEAFEEWRYPALIALGMLSQHQKRPEITELLLKVLNNPAEEYRLRYAAAEALGDLKLAGAVEPLVLMLTDRYVGDVAELALAQVGETAVELLIRNLSDNPNAEVRWHSARALCRIKSEQAREELEKLVSSSAETDPDVRYFTAQALKLLGTIPTTEIKENE